MTSHKSINSLLSLNKGAKLRSNAQYFVLRAIAQIEKDPNVAEENFSNGIRSFLEQHDIDMSVSTITTALQRLHKMGHVSRTWGKETPARGGRRKRLYKIKESGRCALNQYESEEIRPTIALMDAIQNP